MKRLMPPMAAIPLMLLLSGCGQSGPLYVPGNPSTMAVPPSTTSTEDEEQEDGSEAAESD